MDAAALLAAGREAEAAALYAAALARDPAAADAANNLGVLLKRRGDAAGALRRYRQALAAAPGHADAGWNLGRALLEAGELDEAFLHLRRAAAARPGWEGWHMLGRACQERGDLAGAEAAYDRALAARPGAMETLNNLANTMHAAGRLEAALALLDGALAAAPGAAPLRYNRALLLLRLGRAAEGWREHEWRWRVPGFPSPARRFASPAWDGRALPGGTLLLHWEQGFGDTLQFCRYAAAARARVGRVVLEVQAPLVRLLRGLPGVEEVIAAGAPVPEHAAHAALMSLPHLLGEAAGLAPPYLPAPPPPSGRPPVVGLVWSGNPRHANDRNRSIPFAALAPLLDTPGVRFLSLQCGPAAAGCPLPAPPMEDFAATAAALAGVDLVVSVDTAVAHLAGAMGRQVALLLPAMPDWRWGITGEATRWYPAMRLWRQPAPGEWAPVVRGVADFVAGLSRR